MDIQITKSDGTTQTVTGVSATINPTAVIPPDPGNIPLVMGTKISQGMTGKYYYGMNVHAAPGDASKINALGGNVMRTGAFFRGYSPDWPGTFAGEIAVVDECKAALSLGVVPYVVVTNWLANKGNDAGWAAFVKQVVQKTGTSWIECENEPNFNPGFSNSQTAQDYFHLMQITYNAVKAANPNCKMSAPATNANYVANNHTWTAQLMAQPNFWSYIDAWSFHSYNQSIEQSWLSCCNDVITRVLAAKPAAKTITFINSESGWQTNHPGGEGSGDPAEGYSKMPFMRRASRMFTHDIPYALYDGPDGNWGLQGKSFSSIYTDACKRVQAATDASMYARGVGERYVRLNVPGTQELACWSISGDKQVKVVVDSPSPGSIYSRMVGFANATIPVTAGRQQITVPLTLKGRLIGGNGVTFPEFNF